MAKPLTKPEQDTLSELSERIKSVFAHEEISMATVGALANMSSAAVTNVRDGSGTIPSLVKVMRVMGYDITFVRARKPMKLIDDIDAISRLSKNKKNHSNARKKEKVRKRIPSQQELRDHYENSGGGSFL